MMNIDRLNKIVLDKKKLFVLVLIFLVLIYIDFAFFIKLQLGAIESISPKITKLKTDIDKITKDLASAEAIKNKQANRKQESISKPQKLISEEQIPLLLQEIYNAANKNNVKIMQIKPSREVKSKDGKTTAVGKANLLLIILDLTCGYHYFGSFINNLNNSDYFLAIDEMKIMSSPSDYFQHKVNLVLKTYVKK